MKSKHVLRYEHYDRVKPKKEVNAFFTIDIYLYTYVYK